MSYTITIKLDKEISRDDIANILDTEFPTTLKPFGMNDQSWGFPCDMDVMVKQNSMPCNEIKLHAAYGHSFERFLIHMIWKVCDRGYKVEKLIFDM